MSHVVTKYLDYLNNLLQISDVLSLSLSGEEFGGITAINR